MMRCNICGSENVVIDYDGIIRNGGLGNFTSKAVKMYKCHNCEVIWHEPVLNNEEYYESSEYRYAMEGTSDEQDFYRMHDKESMDKFEYTGTTVFRNSIVADIGCGCGAFLDYIHGVAKTIIAIEPSEIYRKAMNEKGFMTYAYAEDAVNDYSGAVDVVTSFDVIEHVEKPKEFLTDTKNLLRKGGCAIIGTPTQAPVMRELLGPVYEKQQLFSTQHLWVFDEKNLTYMAQELGFSEVKCRYYQRYGLDNLMGWLRDKEPCKDIKTSCITETINSAWKSQLAERGMADYIVLYLVK